jgi:hypothetical protein
MMGGGPGSGWPGAAHLTIPGGRSPRRALCHLKLQQPLPAAELADAVLYHAPGTAKALYILGQARSSSSRCCSRCMQPQPQPLLQPLPGPEVQDLA